MHLAGTENIEENMINEVLGDYNVFIINRYPPQTSIYRTAEDIFSVLKGAIWINLLFNADGWNLPHQGIDYRSKFIGNSTLTHALRNFSFADALRVINSGKWKGKKLIHYSNQFSGTFNLNGTADIVSVHDSPHYLERNSIISKLFMRHIYSSIKEKEFILTNTDNLAKELRDYGFTGHITPIHLPYSPVFHKLTEPKDEIRNRLKLPLDKKLILSVSSNSPRKNLPVIRKIMNLLGGGYKLVRVGSSLEDSLNFEGVNDNRLNEIYNACDVLLFPSLYEGFGLPIVEAFASGLPVVTSDLPTIREVAGNAAVLVDPMDTDSILKGIKVAIENESLSEVGLARAKEFTRVNFKEKLIRFYEMVKKSC